MDIQAIEVAMRRHVYFDLEETDWLVIEFLTVKCFFHYHKVISFFADRWPLTSSGAIITYKDLQTEVIHRHSEFTEYYRVLEL